jgi:sec-independent protein translocase protein TatB
MFDFAWSEIALIGVVALIAIGPKDMPAAIKSVTDVIKKARRMASEFQTHVDEMVRDANLQEVRDQIGELRSLNVRGQIEKAIDADGSLRSTLASNPLASNPPISNPLAPEPTIAPMVSPTPVPVAPVEVTELAAATTVAAAAIEAPAFIPPSAVPAPPAPVEEPPAFIPPGATRA